MNKLKNIILLITLTCTQIFASDYNSTLQEDYIIEKKKLTTLEKAFIEIATPYVKRVGLDRIYIADDFENTLYTGGVQIHENSARVMFGIDFRSQYEYLSDDAYAEILCHELGHIVGETAKEEWPNGEEISPEAESDYFAGAICLKKLFRIYPPTHLVIVDPIVMNNCAFKYDDIKEQNLCGRIAMAGIDFFTSFHKSLKKMRVIQGHETFYAIPNLAIKDSRYYTFYPSFQCRAETLASGAYCTDSEEKFDLGKSDWHCKKDHNALGARPACWYKW